MRFIQQAQSPVAGPPRHGGHHERRGRGGPGGTGRVRRRPVWLRSRRWPGGGPRGRGRRARRGDIRTAALLLLAEEPRNGYQIMQEVQERSGGIWSPSPGSVYPALQQLEDEGLIRTEESDGRKLFALTDEGRAVVAERGAERPAPWEQTGGGGGAHELGRLMREVAFAFMQVMRTGSDGPDRQGRDVLAGTRRDLYRILADGDVGGDRDERRRPRHRRRCRYGGLGQVNETATTAASPASATAPSAAVSVDGLVKRYDEIEAVRGIDFDVAQRRDLRLPRAQRRRQVDDDQHAVHARAAERRRRHGGRPRRRHRTRRGAPQHRPRLPGHDARRLPHRRAEPAPARRAVRRAARAGRRAHAPGDGDGRAVGAARQPRRTRSPAA